MGIKIKNLQTGEFEKFNIPALKGEKGEPGEIEPSEKVDYIGKQHSKLRDTMNANVDYIIKTAIGEFNYLDYEGQQITATNTLEGRAKSAILKGQTLVNHCPDSIYTEDWWTGGAYKQFDNFPTLVKGKTYTFYAPIGSKEGNVVDSAVSLNITTDGTTQTIYGTWSNGHGTIFKTFTMGDSLWFSNYSITGARFQQNYPTVMILEGEWTQESMPEYFKGMQSVKMPVLTTIGKNLFNKKDVEFNYAVGNTTPVNENYVSSNFIKVKPSTQYVVNDSLPVVYGFTINKEMIGIVRNTDHGGTFITPNNCYFIRIRNYELNKDHQSLINTAQLEMGSSITTYEPYKSNILSTLEDLELRGIGDVQDALDCLTGEKVERIGEIVLDGSDDELWVNDTWWLKETTTGYEMELPNSGGLAKSDKLPVQTDFEIFARKEDVESVSVSYKWQVIGIRIANEKLTTKDVNGLRAYLSQNPITVQYQLAQESIKTVDLSDNHVYSYKDATHYDCSSADGSLVPTLSVKVPTDTQLTIQEQKATTQTLLIKNMDLQQSIKEVQAMNLAFNTALYNSFNSIREEVEDIKKHVSTNENLEGSF